MMSGNEIRSVGLSGFGASVWLVRQLSHGESAPKARDHKLLPYRASKQI